MIEYQVNFQYIQSPINFEYSISLRTLIVSIVKIYSFEFSSRNQV